MPDLDWAISSINRRQPTLNRWLTFYRGHHPRMFNTRRFDRSFRAVVDGARVNMCGRVVRSFTDLIVHEGWTDSNAADTPEATRLWAESRMDLHLPRLVREAAIYGDGFLSVWPDPDGVPRFALENPRGIAIRTAPEDPTRIDVAVKMWRDVERGLVRVTEYRRDVIFRWAAPSKDGTISKASSLRPLRSTDVPEGADASPETTNPYDVVPVFHIPHAVVDPPYGESVLRDVVPVQLLLNKEVGDLTIASEAATIPSRVFIGSEPDGRDTDAPKPGAVTWLPNPDARVVELAGPSIGPLRGVVDAFAADIGRVSDTPVHEIATTGDWPSGEALKTATARQMNAARELKKTLDVVLTDAMMLALRMAGATVVEARSVWMPIEVKPSDRERAEAALLRIQAGVPRVVVWRELGYTLDEVVLMEELAAEEARVDAALAVRAFDAGAAA